MPVAVLTDLETRVLKSTENKRPRIAKAALRNRSEVDGITRADLKLNCNVAVFKAA